MSHALAQAANHRHFISKIHSQSQVNPFGIYCGQSGFWTVFFCEHFDFPYQIHFPVLSAQSFMYHRPYNVTAIDSVFK